MASQSLEFWIPVSVAAKRLSVSRQRVYELINKGRIGWRKVGSTILVSTSSIDERLERRTSENEI